MEEHLDFLIYDKNPVNTFAYIDDAHLLDDQYYFRNKKTFQYH